MENMSGIEDLMVNLRLLQWKTCLVLYIVSHSKHEPFVMKHMPSKDDLMISVRICNEKNAWYRGFHGKPETFAMENMPDKEDFILNLILLYWKTCLYI